MTDLRNRFMALVQKGATPADCWVWKGCAHPLGYGTFNLNGVRVKAHRLSFILFYQTDIEGLCVCHECDNPRCVNPDHLFLGTHKENMEDRDRKGRVQHGENHYNSKLTADMVREIRTRASESTSALAREYGVSLPTICDVRAGRTWKRVV